MNVPELSSLLWLIHTVSPHFHWQKTFATMVAKKIKVLRKFHWQSFWLTRLTKMSKWLHLNNSHAYPFCKTTPGTISESRQQYCAIELRHQFFRCSNWDRIFVSETRSKRSQNYSVSESEGAPMDWTRTLDVRIGQPIYQLWIPFPLDAI